MEENRKKKAGIKLGVSHGSNPIRIPPITIHQSPPRITSIPDKFSFETVSRNDGDTHTHTQPHTHTHTHTLESAVESQKRRKRTSLGNWNNRKANATLSGVLVTTIQRHNFPLIGLMCVGFFSFSSSSFFFFFFTGQNNQIRAEIATR